MRVNPAAAADIDSLPAPTPGYGEELRRLRSAAGMTREKVLWWIDRFYPLEINGLTASAYSHWEAERRVPLMCQLHAIVTAVKASPEDIVGLIGRLAYYDVRYARFALVWAEQPEKPMIERASEWAAVAQIVPSGPARS